jgi:hypothetical protein
VVVLPSHTANPGVAWLAKQTVAGKLDQIEGAKHVQVSRQDGLSMKEPLVLRLALVAGMLGFSQSACADWQGTVWGMSLEEANKNFRIPHSITPLDLPACDPRRLSCLYFDYTATLEFTGWLEFTDNKLAAIDMKLKDPSQCDELMDVLRQIHGTPAKERTNTDRTGERPFHEITWYDAKNHNRIRVWYDSNAALGYYCNLRYTPFIRSFPVASDKKLLSDELASTPFNA